MLVAPSGEERTVLLVDDPILANLSQYEVPFLKKSSNNCVVFLGATTPDPGQSGPGRDRGLRGFPLVLLTIE